MKGVAGNGNVSLQALKAGNDMVLSPRNLKEEIPAVLEAIEKGDISENAEYDAAKDAQGLLEAKIAQLQDIISNCRIIDESQIDTSKVQILNKVTIKNTKTKATMTYTLVSESEADFKAGKLSITTPIAKALIGKKLGDKVEVQVPAGTMEFEIMDISI